MVLALATVAAISGSIVVEFSAFVIRHVWDQPNSANTAGSTLQSSPRRPRSSRELRHRPTVVPARQQRSGVRDRLHRGAPVVRPDNAPKLATTHALIIAAPTAPLVATSIVFMADRGRPDQWIYGRYNDAIDARRSSPSDSAGSSRSGGTTDNASFDSPADSVPRPSRWALRDPRARRGVQSHEGRAET